MSALQALLEKTFFSPIFIEVFRVLFLTSFVWLPLILALLLWNLWLTYRRTDYVIKQGTVLLEIKIPQIIEKSPKAMEIFLTALYQTGSATYLEVYFGGKIRPWFSFEIVSLGGDVRFFIWTFSKFRRLIEAQIYAQYPNVEVYEATEDYAKKFHYDPSQTTLWGTYFRLVKPDAYPIKTYIDYGLDKDPDEELKIDPMTSILEYLGSMRKGEQVWFQILIQAHKSEGLGEGRLFKRPDWRTDAAEEIKNIKRKAGIDVDKDGPQSLLGLTKGEQDTIAAIERSMDKYAFETMVRAFYIATNETFDPVGITGLIGSFRQYSAREFNEVKIARYTDLTDLGKDIATVSLVPKSWQLSYRRSLERKMLDAFQRRSFFQPPYRNYHAKAFILTTEELATIYHFPGQVAATPTMARIPSKKAQPPSNLPI